MAQQNLTALKQAMKKRFGKESVLELDSTNDFLGGTGFATLPQVGSQTPAADASQSLISGQTPASLPEGAKQETGALGEPKSNASVIIEALANMLKKLSL